MLVIAGVMTTLALVSMIIDHCYRFCWLVMERYLWWQRRAGVSHGEIFMGGMNSPTVGFSKGNNQCNSSL